MRNLEHEVTVEIVLKKTLYPELRCYSESERKIDYGMAANDLKKKILRGTIEIDSFDSIEATAKFPMFDGKFHRTEVLVDKRSKTATVKKLACKNYWTLNKMLRRF